MKEEKKKRRYYSVKDFEKEIIEELEDSIKI